MYWVEASTFTWFSNACLIEGRTEQQSKLLLHSTFFPTRQSWHFGSVVSPQILWSMPLHILSQFKALLNPIVSHWCLLYDFIFYSTFYYARLYPISVLYTYGDTHIHIYIYFLIIYFSDPFSSVCKHWNLRHLRPVVPAVGVAVIAVASVSVAVVAVAIPAVPAVDSLVTYSNMRFIMSTLGHCSSDAGHIISLFCCFSAVCLIFPLFFWLFVRLLALIYLLFWP